MDAVTTTNYVDQPPPLIQPAEPTRAGSSDFASLSLTQDSGSNLHGVVRSTIANRWAADAGFIIGDGPVSQNLVALDVGKFSAFVWNNIDLSQEKVHEVDTGLSYTLDSTPVGPGKLSFRFGFENWFYTSSLLSKNASSD